MELLKKLIDKMTEDMRAALKRDGDIENYDEDAIRIAVYEDLKDTLNHNFSDVIYK
jgi:hypothetical protein